MARDGSGIHRTLLARLAAAVLANCVLLPAGLAFAAVPTAPLNPDPWVSGVGEVSISWGASTDLDGDPIVYDVYRSRAPITAVNLASAALVAQDITATTVTGIVADPDEITQAYVWFYAVVAKAGGESALSKTAAPNLHGYRMSSGVYTCTRCHQVHGAGEIDSNTIALCYHCHASSDATSPETDLGDRSSLNIKADFYDYDSQTAGSRHRSTKMIAETTECDACHTAHRSSYFYTSAGVYDATQSYRKFLRVQTGVDGTGDPTYTLYSQNSVTTENVSFCFACHGAASTGAPAKMGYVSTDGYTVTGGDHNESGYATAAHGTAVVKSNDYGRTNEGQYPQVQCLACHDKHASAADKLIAYRGDDTAATPSGTFAGAELCFACHSAGSAEDRVVAGYSAPFSWNDRDVEAQFSKASAHPVTVAASGRSLACASCHNVHVVSEGGASAWNTSRVVVPSNTKTAVASVVGASFTVDFCLDCHDGAPASPAISTDALVPYRIGFSAQTAPYFTGWDKSTFTTSGHYTAATTKALCQNCHDPHASDFRRLAAWTTPTGVSGLNTGVRDNTSAGMSREQNLCYQCHGNESTVVDGVTTQRAADAKDVITKATGTYGHNPAATTGTHTDTEDAAALGGTNRHAECADCHDPHYATTAGGSATQESQASTAGAAVWGAFGAAPSYPASNWGAAASYSADRLTGEATDFEAYLCFKCHSTNTAQPTTVTRNAKTYTTTDVAREFNPSNFSYHNVLGQGTGMQSAFTVTADNGVPVSVTWPVPTVNVFSSASGMDANVMLTCTSCHTNDAVSTSQAKGPHGSSAEWAIDPAYGADWKTAGLSIGSTNGMMFVGGAEATNIICAKCHDLYNLGVGGESGWSNSAHKGNGHRVTHTQPKYCTNCHIGIPHGWTRPRLLGYYDDPAPYASRVNVTGGQTSYALIEVEASSRSLSSGAVTWSCTTSCKTSAGQHSGDITQSWP